MARRHHGSGRRRRQGGSLRHPGTLPAPPPGTYDPVLDANVRAASRGIGDLKSDTLQNKTRLNDDLLLGINDLNINQQQGLEDIFKGGVRQNQDYKEQTGALNRNYLDLASQQQQQQRSAGADQSGAVAQAVAKRAINHALEQRPLDTALSRYKQDATTDVGRLKDETTRNRSKLTLNYQRGNTDLDTTLTRAVRENKAFGQDTTRSRYYQARESGWNPSTSPGLGTGGRGRRRRPRGPNSFTGGPRRGRGLSGMLRQPMPRIPRL